MVVAQLEGHIGQVFSARWVTGGRVITAGVDGTARLWDGSDGRLLQIGGLDSAALDTYPQTGDKQCPAQAIVAPPGG